MDLNCFDLFAASLLPDLLVFVAVAAVLLSVLQVFLCRKKADRGLPLPIFGGFVSLAMFLWAYAWGLRITGNWIKPVPVALLTLLIFAVPTLVFLLIYRIAKKREARTYLDSFADKKHGTTENLS